MHAQRTPHNRMGKHTDARHGRARTLHGRTWHARAITCTTASAHNRTKVCASRPGRRTVGRWAYMAIAYTVMAFIVMAYIHKPTWPPNCWPLGRASNPPLTEKSCGTTRFHHRRLRTHTVDCLRPSQTTTDHHTSPQATMCYHRLPYATTGYHMLPQATICYHRDHQTLSHALHVTTNHHMLPYAIIGYHTLS